MNFLNRMVQRPFLFFILLFGVHLFLRAPSFAVDFLDVDESQFAGFAHMLMDGGLPYQGSVDTKPPFIYLFYLFCFSLFGKYNMAGVHFVSLMVAWTTSCLLYLIAKEMGNKKAGMAAAFFYGVFSTTYLPKFISTSITSVMVLPLTASFLFWIKKPTVRNKFLSGLFTGVGFLFKYQGGIQVLLPLFDLGINTSSRKIALQKFLKGLIFLAGFSIPLLATLAWLNNLHVLPDFFKWSVQGSKHYINAGGQTIALIPNLLKRGGLFIVSTFLLWILAWKGRRHFSTHLSLWLWFFLSLVPVCVGGRFYGHYFIQLLPPLCLLGAFALEEVKISTRALTTGIVIPALLFWVLRVDFKTTDALFPDDQIFKQEEVGLWLEQNSHPTDHLFVWGFATAIYFHSKLKPASRFLWTDLLTGKVPGASVNEKTALENQRFVRPEAWDALWEDFKTTPPTLIVDTSSCAIHDYENFPLSNYPSLSNYIKQNYQPIANPTGCAIYRLHFP